MPRRRGTPHRPRWGLAALVAAATALPGAAAEGIPTNLHAAGGRVNKVTLPGNPNYRVTLQDLVPAEGTISPKFDPEGTRFTVRLATDSAEYLHLALMLDLLRYSPRHCPSITIDGEPLEYSPLDQVVASVALGRQAGPLERDVTIRVSDPSGGSGGVFGFLQSTQAHEYVIHVVRPPDLNRLVSPSRISVHDAAGHELSPQRTAEGTDGRVRSALQFQVNAADTSATVRVDCPREPGTSQEYDGVPAATGAAKAVDLSRTFEMRTHATCSYTDPRWAPNGVSRTYVVEIGKHVGEDAAAYISAELMLLPESGYCEASNSEGVGSAALRDPDIRAVVADTGFTCRIGRTAGQAVFVATFSSAVGGEPKAHLIDPDAGGAGAEVLNAMPVPVGMQHPGKQRQLELRVQAGDLEIVYTVRVLWPGRCNSAPCSQKQVVRDMDPFKARTHMCLSERCGQQDVGHCCIDRATCQTYPADGCPPFHDVQPDAASILCHGASCSASRDAGTCCASRTSTATSTATTTLARTSAATTMTPTEFSSTSTVLRLRKEKATTSSSSMRSSTSTVTATAEPVCMEFDQVWLPLDMDNARPSIEANSMTCQERCDATSGCAHFAFWTLGRHCHLQGVSAARQPFGLGFVSGPPGCRPGDRTVTTTTTDPVPANERCLQHGVLWSPYLGMPLALPTRGAEEETVTSCQKACAANPGCAHFVADMSTTTRAGGRPQCRLVGIGAQPMAGRYSGFVSGPPHCDAIYQEINDLLGGGAHYQGAREQAAGDQNSQEEEQSSGILNWNCIQWGLDYIPSVAIELDTEPAAAQLGVGRSSEDFALACQTRCQQRQWCHHFVAHMSDNSCRLARAGSRTVASLSNTASGPRHCDALGAELAVLKRDELHLIGPVAWAPDARHGTEGLRWSFATAGGGLLVVATLVWVSSCRTILCTRPATFSRVAVSGDAFHGTLAAGQLRLAEPVAGRGTE